MPTTALSTGLINGPHFNSLHGKELAFQAADVSNGNHIPAASVSDNMVLLARNTGASSRTVTIISVPDSQGRSGDVTAKAVAAGKTRLFKLRKNGWASASANSGNLLISANHAEVEFCVIDLTKEELT